MKSEAILAKSPVLVEGKLATMLSKGTNEGENKIEK